MTENCVLGDGHMVELVLLSLLGWSLTYWAIDELTDGGGGGGGGAPEGAGDDSFDTSASTDPQTIRGYGGNDSILTGDGDDSLQGDSGADTITSAGGDDTIWGGLGEDLIDAGPGNNEVDAGFGDDTVVAGTGNDTVRGGDGNDSIGSTGGDDRFYLEEGDDTGLSLGGQTLINGGQGDDLLAALDTEFSGTTALAGAADTLVGGGGNDTLSGDDGDIMTGDTGADSFQVFVEADPNGGGNSNIEVVTVTDFNPAEDVLRIFTDVTPTPVFADLTFTEVGTPTAVVVAVPGATGLEMVRLENTSASALTASNVFISAAS